MSDLLSQPQTAQGKALYEEFLWVHAAIRRDLDTVRRLSAECLEGRDPAELSEEIRSLEANGPLWQLKVNCLHYCRFVHSHHNAEDALFFPAMRRANPDLAGVIDRLESEHRGVSDLLDAVEAAAAALSESDAGAQRRALSDALDSLSRDLLAHLDYEEEQIEPTVTRMQGLR